jgi:pyridoxamine 5'-phosphate oxidase
MASSVRASSDAPGFSHRTGRRKGDERPESRFYDHPMNTLAPTDPGNEDAVRKWLTEPLPADPLPALEEWIAEAASKNLQPNPNAMALATVDADGRPSARIVLCRAIDLDAGYVEFFTNTRSRKGEALAAHPHAALLFHWDDLNRQVRIEGPIVRTPDARADEYFATRHPVARLGAWASEQSRPIDSRAALDEKVREAGERFGLDLDRLAKEGRAMSVDVPRPEHWGGYRVYAERAELWIGRDGRIHDRALWTRELTATGDEDIAYRGGAWRAQRLQP